MEYPSVRHWELTDPRRFSYRWLWMKYVGVEGADDVDLSKHCQECLGGVKSRKFSLGARQGYTERPPILLDEVHRSRYCYICAGSASRQYEHNLHIVFRRQPGSNFEVRTPREIWQISDGERLDIVESMIDPTDPRILDATFRTCRCWQFGHFLRRELEKEGRGRHGRLPGFLF